MDRMVVLVDTSAIVAVLNRADDNHQEALRLLGVANKSDHRLFATNFLIGETYATLLARVGPSAALRWLAENDIPVVRVSARDEQRAREILFKYRDKSFSYVDATSFAVMERLKVATAFTFDKHFEQYGFKKLH